ncbi:hypothetical protein NQZ68_001269 [Dissostichus eleginoides]|nr:hypothetical protein NQZ68_001269 [Dissostichus eleginoides]
MEGFCRWPKVLREYKGLNGCSSPPIMLTPAEFHMTGLVLQDLQTMLSCTVNVSDSTSY